MLKYMAIRFRRRLKLFPTELIAAMALLATPIVSLSPALASGSFEAKIHKDDPTHGPWNLDPVIVATGRRIDFISRVDLGPNGVVVSDPKGDLWLMHNATDAEYSKFAGVALGVTYTIEADLCRDALGTTFVCYFIVGAKGKFKIDSFTRWNPIRI